MGSWATNIEAARGHEDACLAIARALPAYFNAEGLAAIEADLAVHDGFVGLDAAGVAGFLVLAQRAPKVAEIAWMAVASAHQRGGLGSALIAHAAHCHAARGGRLLTVKTLADTVAYAPYEPTRAFYAREGFCLVEVVDPYPGWGPGNPCAIYVRAV